MPEKVALQKLRGGRARLTVRGIELTQGWSADVTYVGPNLVQLRLWHEDGDDAPPITAMLLRQVSVEQLRRTAYAERLLAKLRDERSFDPAAEKAADYGWRKPRGGRKQEWTPERLLRFIARYDELLNKEGHPDPYAVLIKEWELEKRPTAARGAVRLAHTQGLWEPAGKGKRGGELTAKAKRLLRKGK